MICADDNENSLSRIFLVSSYLKVWARINYKIFVYYETKFFRKYLIL